MQEFDFSESGLKNRQRFIWILLFASEPFIFLLLLLTTEINLSILLISFAISTFMILTVVAVQMSFMKKTIRAMKNEILEEIWRNRDEFAGEHNYDIDAMVAALQKMEKQSPNQIIDRRGHGSKESYDPKQKQDNL